MAVGAQKPAREAGRRGGRRQETRRLALRLVLWMSLPTLWLGMSVYQGVRRRHLYEAVAAGNTAQARALLDSGMDPNVVVNIEIMGWRDTPELLWRWPSHFFYRRGHQREDRSEAPILVCAAEKGRQDIVAELLRRGARVNIKDSEGTTPLMAAAGAGNVPIAILLLAHGAHPNATDNDGETALMTGGQL